jgi:chemosensory pili system protein ChpE
LSVGLLIMTTLFLSSFILGIAFCAPPGIITAETMRRGLLRGFRPALSVQLGSLVGDTTWATIALTGLAFVIQNETTRSILSFIGIILLLRLAWGAIQEARTGTELVQAPPSNRGDFASGVLLSLSNPFNIAFWVGISTTAFAGVPGGPQAIHFVVFFTAFLGSAVLWCFFMAGLVAWGKQWMTQNFFRWVNLTCGAALIYFAIQLGMQTAQSLI